MPEDDGWRQLTDDESRALQRQGCSSDDWSSVFVREGFQTETIQHARFSGQIRLGLMDSRMTMAGGVELPSGIYHASLHNCTVADDVRIANIGRYVANYDIGPGVLIEHVGLIAVNDKTCFGNDLRAEVMVEGGGRALPLFDRLSSQIAYLLCFSRHRQSFVEAMEAIIAKYAKSRQSDRGQIEAGARIVDSDELINVRIGPAARISGALRLEEGSVNSTSAAPCIIRNGVIARKFIMASGSTIENASQIDTCFVGQGVRLGQQAVAKHSVLFANTEVNCSELSNVFAGPYTASHHKSSLLIAGMYSFFNAASGTNAANHMYRLGPVHQAVLERGCKTGMSCCCVWPCRVGAFSTVIGRHYSQFDSSPFPFSRILEQNGKSILIPAHNLFSVGVARDDAKWPGRERRGENDRLDHVRRDVFNPYTVGRMIQGRDLLAELHSHAPAQQESVNWTGLDIPRDRIHEGWKEYNFGIALYLGEKVALCAETVLQLGGKEAVEKQLIATRSWGLGEWIDVGGVVLPSVKVERLLATVEEGSTEDLFTLEEQINAMAKDYPQMEWNWVLTMWLSELGRDPQEVTRADIVSTIESWRDALLEKKTRLHQDADKESDPAMRYGYGMLDSSTADEDFEAVRSTQSASAFLQELDEKIHSACERAERLIRDLA